MKGWAKTLIASAAVAAVIVGVNVVRVNSAASEALKHTGEIRAYSYYRYGVVPDVVVFDLREVKGNASNAMVLGRFFAFAEEMKDREFREVHLAFRGETKFIMRGGDFRKIGREFSWQNPVYLVRTLPAKLRSPDGRAAYSTWSGGMLGVLSAQMNDVNDIAREWYLDDMLKI